MSDFIKKQKPFVRVLLTILLLVVLWFFLKDSPPENGNENPVPTESVTGDVTTPEPSNTPTESVSASKPGNSPSEAAATPEPTTIPATPSPTPSSQITEPPEQTEIIYWFRNEDYLMQHFQKHGEEFPYETAQDYLAGANRVVQSPDALHKLEAEDGDDIYYLEATNEFVVVSTDGYLRTYFKPSAGIDYYNRQ